MSDFSALQTAFSGDLITPENATYNEAISRWAINSQMKAQIVAFPKDANDISLIVNYARANNLPFAIKGGGHSTAGNSSSTGAVVDQSRYMNTVEIDSEKQLACVGAGCLWSDVDKAAIEKGFATVGGTVNNTGVAGLTVGGGYGWLSGTHGLVIDNLVQATVVVADGRVLTASASENSDLFFGIRGGGSNFGVVTQFVFKIHPQRRMVFAGPLMWPADRLEEVIEATNKWCATQKPHEGAMHHFSKGPSGPVINTVLFYNGSEADGRESFKPILDLKPAMDLCTEIPYENLNTLINHTVPYGKCWVFKGAFYTQVEEATVKKMFERLVASTADEHDTKFVIEYYNLSKLLSVPEGETAFVRKDAGNVIIATSWDTDTPENSAHGRAITRELNDFIVESQKGLLGNDNQGYGNYDQDGTAEKNIGTVKSSAENLFGKNYPRLQQIKAKYDPQNFFCKWFAIQPATT